MIRRCITCAIFIIVLAGCKTSSVVTSTPSAPVVKNNASRDILDSMQRHAFNFEWFTGKAKVEIVQGTDKTEFTASLRMRKDSAIWISVSPALGLEVARVLMTKDSIRVIDRLNGEYYSKDYHFFKTYTALPVTFEVMQDMIEGSPLFMDGKEFDVTRKDTSYLLKWEAATQATSLTLNRTFLPVLQTITDSSTSLRITQQQYEIPYTSPFSLWRRIELLRPEAMQIVITFSKIKINEPVKLPFNVKE
ncbi:MAG: DUF4292 domain-containing protein [Chitinophagales bacterium]